MLQSAADRLEGAGTRAAPHSSCMPHTEGHKGTSQSNRGRQHGQNEGIQHHKVGRAVSKRSMDDECQIRQKGGALVIGQHRQHQHQLPGYNSPKDLMCESDKSRAAETSCASVISVPQRRMQRGLLFGDQMMWCSGKMSMTRYPQDNIKPKVSGSQRFCMAIS